MGTSLQEIRKKKKKLKKKSEISTISEKTLKRLQPGVIKIGYVWK